MMVVVDIKRRIGKRNDVVKIIFIIINNHHHPLVCIIIIIILTPGKKRCCRRRRRRLYNLNRLNDFSSHDLILISFSLFSSFSLSFNKNYIIFLFFQIIITYTHMQQYFFVTSFFLIFANNIYTFFSK